MKSAIRPSVKEINDFQTFLFYNVSIPALSIHGLTSDKSDPAHISLSHHLTLTRPMIMENLVSGVDIYLTYSKMNDIGHLFFRPSPPYRDSDIRSSDKKLWGLTPLYPYLIVTNENFCLNLE